MIPVYVSPPIDLVLFLGTVAAVVGWMMVKLLSVPLKPIHGVGLLLAAVAATGISLLYSYQFRGGDLFWQRHGYPHYFWGFGSEKGYAGLMPHNVLQGFDFGPLGIYFLGDVFFFASLFLCAYALFFVTRNRIRSRS